MGCTSRVLVLPDGRIIDGHNRWELSGGHAPVEVCDVSEERALELVCDLNEIRRQYSPEEWAEQREERKRRVLALRQEGKTQAEVADIVGVPLGTLKTWEVVQKKGRERNKVNVNLVSPPDLRVTIRREARVQVAKRVKKESTAQVAADLHVTVRRVEQIVQQEKARKRKPKPAPTGTYNVIYADPPWPYDTQIKSWGPTSLHYETMPLDKIRDLPKATGLSIAKNAVPVPVGHESLSPGRIDRRRGLGLRI